MIMIKIMIIILKMIIVINYMKKQIMLHKINQLKKIKKRIINLIIKINLIKIIKINQKLKLMINLKNLFQILIIVKVKKY